MSRVWDWFEEYAEKILDDDQCGNRHVRMLELFDAGTDDDADPRFNISCMKKARKLSDSLGEDQFTLWCDAWIAQELDSIGELKKSREILSDAVLRSRKPIYNGTPQQLMVNVALAVNLSSTDPPGYAADVRKLYDFVKKNSGPFLEHVMRMTYVCTSVSIEEQDWAMVNRWIDALQQLCASHFQEDLWGVPYLHARMACVRKDWSSMLTNGDEGLRQKDLPHEAKKSLLLIRACALAALGDPKAAKVEFRRASTIRRDILDSDDYMFSTWYWLHLGNMDAAIQTRLDQQSELSRKGRYWEQLKGMLHLASLYQTAGNSAAARRWLKSVEKVRANLRNPDSISILQKD